MQSKPFESTWKSWLWSCLAQQQWPSEQEQAFSLQQQQHGEQQQPSDELSEWSDAQPQHILHQSQEECQRMVGGHACLGGYLLVLRGKQKSREGRWGKCTSSEEETKETDWKNTIRKTNCIVAGTSAESPKLPVKIVLRK